MLIHKNKVKEHGDIVFNIFKIDEFLSHSLMKHITRLKNINHSGYVAIISERKILKLCLSK